MRSQRYFANELRSWLNDVSYLGVVRDPRSTNNMWRDGLNPDVWKDVANGRITRDMQDALKLAMLDLVRQRAVRLTGSDMTKRKRAYAKFRSHLDNGFLARAARVASSNLGVKAQDLDSIVILLTK